MRRLCALNLRLSRRPRCRNGRRRFRWGGRWWDRRWLMCRFGDGGLVRWRQSRVAGFRLAYLGRRHIGAERRFWIACRHRAIRG